MSERMNSLSAHLTRLLARLSAPRGMATEQSQADEVAAMMRAIDRVAPKSGYDAWWVGFADTLAAAASTRAWPTVFEIERAANALNEKIRASTPQHGGGSDFELAYQHLLGFWGTNRACLRSCLRPGSSARLVREGRATWGQLQLAHFPIPEEGREAAEHENRPHFEGLMDTLASQTAHLRREDAPAGETRSRRDAA